MHVPIRPATIPPSPSLPLLPLPESLNSSTIHPSYSSHPIPSHPIPPIHLTAPIPIAPRKCFPKLDIDARQKAPPEKMIYCTQVKRKIKSGAPIAIHCSARTSGATTCRHQRDCSGPSPSNCDSLACLTARGNSACWQHCTRRRRWSCAASGASRAGSGCTD